MKRLGDYVGMLITISFFKRSGPIFAHWQLISKSVIGLWLCFGITTAHIQPVQANRALPTDLSYSTETTWLLPGLPDLTAAAGTIPHNFKQNELAPFGFRAGKDYPEMSIHDLAWSLDTLTYYYPAEQLRPALEAFIRQTRPAETPSLIHAVFLYYNLAYDTAWLQQEIADRSIIEHLNVAAEQFYTSHLAQDYLLLRQTAPTPWTQRALITNGEAALVDQNQAALYDQALAYLAFIELATMNAALGQTAQADIWQKRAVSLKIQGNTHLWQDQGFYQAYFPLTASSPPEPSPQVSIANALAVYSGLSDFQQNKSLLAQLERVRVEADSDKPGLSVFPTYSASEAMARYGRSDLAGGEGLNGGVWDWWAGVQIKAEFLRGFAEMGQTHLLQVVREWQKHPGNIIEWQATTTSENEGSHYHTVAAGTVGSAIIEGFFGVQLDGAGLQLQPRLGLNDGFIRVYQPTTDRYVAYSYDWDQTDLRLNYGTNVAGAVNIKIWERPSENMREILLDGQTILFEREQIGQDTYLTVMVPTGQHQIQVLKGQPAPNPTPSSGAAPSEESSGPPKENIAPNVTPRDGISETASTGESSNDATAAMAAKNVSRTWQALLYTISTSWVILTSLLVILLVIIRRFSRLKLRIK